MAVETVTGTQATIHFDAQKCIHSRQCVLSHPDVFVPNVQGAWIHPDAQPVQELIRLGQNCPSGAIRVVRNAPAASDTDLASSDGAPLVNTVRVRENGPLAVEAGLHFKGQPLPTPRATLCRCGQSSNKPYCDGSHTGAGFAATGEPATGQFEALAKRDGPLDILPLPNGPLRLVGNLEIVSGTGRTCNKVSETYLCRCGHSNNKPYCDGSHKAAGFQAA
jgi:CDGSH-type Zn-finger protein/uncharacterized Fe-S cluster protein YjdI